MISLLRQVYVGLLRQDRQPIAQDLFQRGGIVQRTPQHAGEGGRHLLHEFGCQGRLADATHTQDGHQAAVVSQQPALQFA